MRLVIASVVALTLRSYQPPPGLPTDAEVRRMLNVRCNFDEGHQILLELGADVFPSYLRILRSKDVTAGQMGSIFTLAARTKGDRTPFVEHAVGGLAHPNRD